MFVTGDVCVSDLSHHRILDFAGFQRETYLVSHTFHPWKCTPTVYKIFSVKKEFSAIVNKKSGTFFYQDDREFLTCVSHVIDHASSRSEDPFLVDFLSWLSKSEFSERSGSISVKTSSPYFDVFKTLVDVTNSSVGIHVLVDSEEKIEDIWFNNHGGKIAYEGSKRIYSSISIDFLPILVKDRKIDLDIIDIRVLRKGVPDTYYYSDLIMGSVMSAITCNQFRDYRVCSIDTRFSPVRQRVIVGRNAPGLVNTVGNIVCRRLEVAYGFRNEKSVFFNEMGGSLLIMCEFFKINFSLLNGLDQGFRLDVTMSV